MSETKLKKVKKQEIGHYMKLACGVAHFELEIAYRIEPIRCCYGTITSKF